MDLVKGNFFIFDDRKNVKL